MSEVIVHQNYIDGRWCAALSAETYERRNPYDQSLVSVFQNSDERDVECAIDAARRAFGPSHKHRAEASQVGPSPHPPVARQRWRQQLRE